MHSYHEFTDLLQGYHESGPNKGTAHCPAHDDAKPSLSCWLDDKGKIAFDCKAGCGHYEVLQALGLREADLYTEDAEPLPKWNNGSEPSTALTVQPTASLAVCSAGPGKLVDEYHYLDACGNELKKQRFQAEDGSKTFRWYHRTGDGIWRSGGTGETVMPYNYDNPSFDTKKDVIVFVEGEKDVKTCVQLGIPYTVSLPDGAGSKWKEEYNGLVAGRKVYIIPDCDNAGYDYRDNIESHAKPLAAGVFTLDLALIWKDVTGEEDPPAKADITDLLNLSDAETVRTKLGELIAYTHQITPPQDMQPLLAEMAENGVTQGAAEEKPKKQEPLPIFRKLADVEETEAEWLIENCIPAKTISLMVGPGGLGKTTILCNIAADLSNGRPTIINPYAAPTEPKTVLILSTEDSVSTTLKKKLRTAGANQENIIVMDPMQDVHGELKHMKISSDYFNNKIREFHPDLVILDPIQGFLPPNLNMASRNGMRDCLQTLLTLGGETGTTFILVVHTNKRQQFTSPRDIVADSADLWDISRSVWFIGRAGPDSERFLSNEKNNYAELQPTVLFEHNGTGRPDITGTSDKRVMDFQNDDSVKHSGVNVKAILTSAIMEILYAQPDHRITAAALETQLKTYCSFTDKQQRYAKDKLKEKGLLIYETEPSSTGTTTYVRLTEKALQEKGKQTKAAAEENRTAQKQPAAIKTTVNPPAWVAEADAVKRTEILGQVTLEETPAEPALPKLKLNALPPDKEADEEGPGYRLGFKPKWQPPKTPPKANPKNGPVFDVVFDGETYHVQIPTNPPAWAKYCSEGPVTWESDWMPLEDCIVDAS